MKSKEAFIKGAEAFLYIKDKEDRVRPWRCNNTQHMVLNAYFEDKDAGKPHRGVYLKGRQQGCSTGVSGIGYMHMMCHRGANLLIASEEKQASGKNIYNMYRLYKEKFPIQYPLRSDVNNELIEFGDELNNGLIRVSGERKVVSFTYKFIHLSEAAKFQQLDEFMDEMLETVPMHLKDASIFVESTAEAYGDQFHELWQMAEKGSTEGVGWKAVFIPWYVHEEYEYPFKDEVEKEKFAESLNNSKESRYGDEVTLLKDTPVIEIPTINGKVKKVGMTLEKLKWRRDKIAMSKYSLARFHRQYPTTADEAFLTAMLNVIDRESLDWYTKERVHDPETGRLRMPERVGEFLENDDLSKTYTLVDNELHGVVTIFEEPKVFREYIIGVDLAEGLESGDFSCALVICRLPFRLVARLRGFDGRNLDSDEFSHQLFALGNYYNTAHICPENNKDGGGVVKNLLNWGYNKLTPESLITGNHHTKRYGWMNTAVTKKRAVNELQKAFRQKTIDITDEMVIEEAKHLIYGPNGKVQAAKKGQRRRPGSLPTGYYDDTIFALGGALLLESVLDAPKTEKVLEAEEKAERVREREHRMRDRYDENSWLDYC